MEEKKEYKIEDVNADTDWEGLGKFSAYGSKDAAVYLKAAKDARKTAEAAEEKKAKDEALKKVKDAYDGAGDLATLVTDEVAEKTVACKGRSIWPGSIRK